MKDPYIKDQNGVFQFQCLNHKISIQRADIPQDETLDMHTTDAQGWKDEISIDELTQVFFDYDAGQILKEHEYLKDIVHGWPNLYFRGGIAMKLMFIGADHEVTGSCHYVEACGKRFIVDYGMEQGLNVYENVDLPVNAGNLDFILLTHAHIDHFRADPAVVCKRVQRKDLCDKSNNRSM